MIRERAEVGVGFITQISGPSVGPSDQIKYVCDYSFGSQLYDGVPDQVPFVDRWYGPIVVRAMRVGTPFVAIRSHGIITPIMPRELPDSIECSPKSNDALGLLQLVRSMSPVERAALREAINQ